MSTYTRLQKAPNKEIVTRVAGSTGGHLYQVAVKNSEYDQEIPQSQTVDSPMAPRGRAAQPSRDTRKTNKAKQPALSSPLRLLQY